MLPASAYLFHARYREKTCINAAVKALPAKMSIKNSGAARAIKKASISSDVPNFDAIIISLIKPKTLPNIAAKTIINVA